MDFGIAVKLENDEKYRNSSVGTPWYTAPEVINGEDYRCLLIENFIKILCNSLLVFPAIYGLWDVHLLKC